MLASLGSLSALPLFGLGKAVAAETASPLAQVPSGTGNSGFVSVKAPGISNLPYDLKGGVKEFQLTAEPVVIMLPDMSDAMGMKGRPVNVWGYNGSMIGPTIEAVEGDTVRVIFTNKLSEPTTVHFHGLEIPHRYGRRAALFATTGQAG